jgi:hypothetical protein
VTRRTDLLDELAALRDFGATPRIDTIRNRLAATVTLLGDVQPHLADLHALAYDRATARREAVNGGDRDYALDTHGDPRARTAYKHLALATIDACELLAEAAHDVTRLLKDGDHDHTKSRHYINDEELAVALAAKATRIARGENESIPTNAQPNADMTARVLARVIAERDALQRKVDHLERQLPDQPRREKRGWRKTPKDT